MLIILPLLIAAISSGFVFVVIGLCGKRVDDHPLCRKCKYDLVGTEQLPANCPECGTELNKPRATRIGNRKRRRKTLVVGLLILIASLTTTGLLGWAQAKNFDWYPYKPLWMLQTEIEQATPGSAKKAEAEIIARLEDGVLSQRQISNVVDDALVLQADANKVWNRLWGNFIETAWTQEKVSDQQISQYLKTATASGLLLVARSKVQQGSRMPVKRGFSNPRAGTKGKILISRNYLRLMIADTNVAKGSRGSGLGPMGTGGGWSAGAREFDLPIGKHTLTFECRFRAIPNGLIDLNTLFKMEDDEKEKFIEENKFLDWIDEVSIPLEVVAPDESVIELVDDPGLKQAIEQAITVKQVELKQARWLESRCWIEFDALPIPVGFEVFWRVGEQEWSVQKFTAFKAKDSMDDHRGSRRIEGFPIDTTHVDIILRSSAEVAEQRVGLNRIWQGEIIIPNQPLTRDKEHK